MATLTDTAPIEACPGCETDGLPHTFDPEFCAASGEAPGLPWHTDPLTEELGELDREDRHADIAERMAFEAKRDAHRLVISLLAQLNRIEQAAAVDAQWLASVQAMEADKRRRRAAAMDFLKAQIEYHAKPLLAPKSKHVDVPGFARIQFTEHKPTVAITDAEALIAWAKANEHAELVRVKEEPKVAEIKALVKETGELLPGLEPVPAHTTSSIQWSR